MRGLPPEWPWSEEDIAGGQRTTPHEIDIERIAGTAARCFRGSDGEMLVRYLRALTLDRALGPDADGAALRHVEGQRHLVRHLCRLIQLGRSGSDTPNATEGDHE